MALNSVSKNATTRWYEQRVVGLKTNVWLQFPGDDRITKKVNAFSDPEFAYTALLIIIFIIVIEVAFQE